MVSLVVYKGRYGMNWDRIGRTGMIAGIGGMVLASTVTAQIPTDRPFSMRGVELGITLDEFRAAQIPNDDNRFADMQSGCSVDGDPMASKFYLSEEDKTAGVVECKWYSNDTLVRIKTLWEHWISIGNGKGIPTFRFIESDGALRLFEISFYANNSYHSDIHDALTRGYGPAKETVEPFKTKAGGDFTSLTSVWDNGLSTITLVQRCAHLERYCLTYRHSELVRPYLQRKEQQAAQAASRI
jgi:hypothetical protein